MSAHETAASIEADRDATNADHEDQALRPEPAHATTVKPITRRAHEIERVVLVVRCVSCKYAREYPEADVVRARREARLHEANGVAV